MSFPLKTVPHVILKAWLAEERYSIPLSAGQRNTGTDVAVGVIVVRELVADAKEAAEAAEEAAAALDATGIRGGRPGRLGKMVGSTKAVERPPRMLLLGSGSAMLGMLILMAGSEMLGI